MNRREVLAVIAAGLYPRRVEAQDRAIGYANLDHVSLQISNVERSLGFYSQVFGSTLRKENDAPRYYVKLGSAYIAMAQFAAGRTARIDHFCAGFRGMNIDQAKEFLGRQGIAFTTPPPFGLFFPDPEGIRVQLWTENSWTDVGKTTSPVAAPAAADRPVVQPVGLSQIVLTVSDLEKAAGYYGKLFGAPARLPNRAGVRFQVGQSQLVLEERAGRQPAVDRFRVLAAPFDISAVRQSLQKLGVATEALAEGAVAFRDSDGIKVEIAESNPA